MKTLSVYKNGQWEEVVASPAGLEDYAKTEYVDAAIAEVSSNVGMVVLPMQDSISNALARVSAVETGKADKATTYTKDEVDAKIPAAGGSVDLSPYAKTEDAQQSILTKTITSRAYGFGSTLSPTAGLVYADTGQGYGTRLVLTVGGMNEFVVYKSDLEPLNALVPRVEALESKAAPTVDLAPYVTLEFADATYGRKEALDLLRSQTQTIFDSIYTRAEADARYPLKAEVYTQKQSEDRFMRIDQAFSKTDFDNQMVTTLYSRKQIDDKLTAISPLGSPSINDPALADFRKSVMDAVALMMAGGTKQPPADIGWTNCLNPNGTPQTVVASRMIGGVIEFRGVMSISSGTGSRDLFKLPDSFPPFELMASYPVAARLVGSNAIYAYVTTAANGRVVGVTPAASINEVTVSGLRARAAY